MSQNARQIKSGPIGFWSGPRSVCTVQRYGIWLDKAEWLKLNMQISVTCRNQSGSQGVGLNSRWWRSSEHGRSRTRTWIGTASHSDGPRFADATWLQLNKINELYETHWYYSGIYCKFYNFLGYTKFYQANSLKAGHQKAHIVYRWNSTFRTDSYSHNTFPSRYEGALHTLSWTARLIERVPMRIWSCSRSVYMVQRSVLWLAKSKNL